MRTKVPQAISSNFFLRLVRALAGGVCPAFPRRPGLGQRPDVTVNSEVGFLVGFLLGTPLLFRRHLGASKQVYPAAACDRNQKFRLSGRK